MCLICFQLQDHPNYKLVITANRDEFYSRPTAQAQFWQDNPNILAGRDLLQMGTWLGVTRQGKFAALTNYRSPNQEDSGKISRGEIVSNYLKSDMSAEEYLETLHRNRDNYVGFNVMLGNCDQLFYYNNIQAKSSLIKPGTHALSNHFLNTPWPKVTKGKRLLKTYMDANNNLDTDMLFNIMNNAEEATGETLPNTGLNTDLERKLSPLFIRTPDYGTRSTTILLIDKKENVTFVERTYSNEGLQKENRFSFQIMSD